MENLARVASGALGGSGVEGRLQNSIPVSASPNTCPNPVPVVPREPGKVKCPSGRGGEDVKERSYRDSRTSRECRILQQAFSGAESHRRMATGSGCIPSQPVREKDQILNGDSQDRLGFHLPGRLAVLHRLAGCVFSSSYSSRIQEISEICSRRGGVPVQSPVFWTKHGTPSVHTSVCTSSENSAPKRYKSDPIPRRLVSVSQIEGGTVEGPGSYKAVVRADGVRNQSQEITITASTEIDLSGYANRFPEFVGFTHSESRKQSIVSFKRIQLLKQTVSKEVAETVGPHGIIGNVHSRGKIEDEAIPVQSSSSVEQTDTTRFRSNQDLDYVKERNRLVDGRGSIEQRSIASNQEPEPVLVLRRVKRGMGSNSRREPKFRQMVPTGTAAAHKPEGTTGSLESSDSSRKSGGRKDSGCVFRQYDGSCISVQSGGTRSWELYCLTRHILIWTTERGIQLIPQFVPGIENVTAHSLSRKDQILPTEWSLHPEVCKILWRKWGQPFLDLFATSLQSQATKVCFSTPGPSSMGSGCLPIPMFQPGPVCLSTLCSDKESDKPIQKFQEQQVDVS